MPSPFPGMDPYLEGALWMNVHSQLSTEIARQLAPQVRPRYVVLTTEWFVVAESNGLSIATSAASPDVGVVRTDAPGSTRWSTGAATAPLQLVTVVPERILHMSVEIRDRENRELVTAIEVLSPSNKRGEGRGQYLAKRRRILTSPAHLLEIDLLHEGLRVPMREPLPEASYFVILNRAEKRPLSDVWPICLWDPLPVTPVPLLADDADVALDLSKALATIYDLLGFDLSIDYSRPPSVALSPEQNRWVEERLREAGTR
jgi:hypothetical protein